MNQTHKPEILAPAGDTQSYLAALAAGADAVYAGLKHFSARMEAENFSLSELAALADLGRDKGAKLYVAMNVLAKPGDLAAAGRLAARLSRTVKPAGLIVQDLGLADAVRQAGFDGELHFSTLAAVTHPAGLAVARRLGADRVVLPRELSVDEVKACAAACPEDLALEVFVHGALCYNVSGRCWWSSYLGGKSGLRGRCVQPCRRVYTAKNRKARLFSCNDLSLDVLARTMLDLPQIVAWKIEGRKKGPHYVYYTTTAYRLLRDNPGDPAAKKTALGLLEQALSRPTTHYRFLPQRPQLPVEPEKHTGSGLFVGKTGGTGGGFSVSPRVALIPGDLLRIGFEDQAGHRTLPVRKAVPKGGKLTVPGGRGPAPAPGSPVFLVDRREPELMRLLDSLGRELKTKVRPEPAEAPEFAPNLPKPLARSARGKLMRMTVVRRQGKEKHTDELGLWLMPRPQEPPRGLRGRAWWWLPPVIWPADEGAWNDSVAKARRAGAVNFVLNAPWQIGLFEGFLAQIAKPTPRGERPPRPLSLWAGPFCNTANPLAIAALAKLGFSGAVVSPELPGADLLALPSQSCLPLGIVTRGQWPLGITRAGLAGVKGGTPVESPKGEVCWAREVGGDVWIYPGWGLDLGGHEAELIKAGYAMFIRLVEHKPKAVPTAARFSSFNWDLELL
jgi:putative protease